MAEERVKEVRGPGNRHMRGGPRPKIKNPGKLFMRLMSYVFKDYGIHMVLVVGCIILSVVASYFGELDLSCAPSILISR